MKKIFQQKILLKILYAVILYLPFFSYAQESRTIDSLKQLLKKIPSTDKIREAKELITLGQQYIFGSNYTAAMDYYQQSLAIAQNINNDSLQAGCYVGLAVIAYYQHDLSKDSMYNFKALEIFRKSHDTLREGKTLRNIAATFAQEGDLANANKYFEQALPIFLKLHLFKFAAGIYSNMAAMYRWNFRKSIELELAAKKIWDKDPNDGVLPAANMGNLGIHYFYLVKFDSLKSIKHDSIIPASASENLERAENYLRLAINMAQQNNDLNNQSQFIGELAELQEYKGDYKDAYLNIRKFHEIQDSLFSQENKNQIAALESRNEIGKKNQEIEKEKLNVQAQKKNIILLVLGLVTMIIIGVLYYRLSIVRREKNKELTKLNTQLDEANKVKAKFFGILSHDLRSPIANLINFIRLQKREPGLLSEQQVQEREQKITSSAESLLETMEAMLLWSKGQMEQFKPQIQTVAVNSLFHYLDKTFSSNDNIQFVFSNPQNLAVATDENYLQTIMHNLTSNAVKALTKTADGKIEWKAIQQDGKTILSISDNGPGLTEEYVYTLHNETVAANAKTGLGLHLIRDLAKAIQCSISVQSQPGGGTTFSLLI